MRKINNNLSDKIRDEIINFIEPDIYYCYQCGRCTAGCPLANVYEYQPNQIIRLVQANEINSIFDSNSIYLCLSCEICSSRCPQGIDIAAIMSYLCIKSWENRSFKEKLIENICNLQISLALFFNFILLFFLNSNEKGDGKISRRYSIGKNSLLSRVFAE